MQRSILIKKVMYVTEEEYQSIIDSEDGMNGFVAEEMVRQSGWDIHVSRPLKYVGLKSVTER